MSRHFTTANMLEPSWRRFGPSRPVGIPPQIWRWLADAGSLTTRVVAACPGHFQVRVLGQGWGRPLASERKALGLKRKGMALIREVELQCDDEAWVFARTVIPASSLKGGARRLIQLGDRPLGALLFADPTTRRGKMELARLGRHHALYRAACGGREALPAELWGRRTLFCFRGKPLLVNEIFLPGIPAAIS